MKYVGENAFKKWTSLVKSDIKKKLDKNQGTANSGKILGVDASGEVAPTDTEVATLVDVPNGIVKGDGNTLSAAVAGTDYMTPPTGGITGQVLKKTEIGTEWADAPVPDWNQNDSTAADYVKNRPFYTGDPVETVLVEESTVAFTLNEQTGLYMAQFPSTFEAIVGETYKVSWDGSVYECICADFTEISVIGNLFIAGVGSDTGEPFIMIVNNGNGIQIGTTNTSSSHTFSISRIVVPVVKIDKKYLAQPDWNQNDETAADFVKNRPFYSETGNVTVENAINNTVLERFPVFAIGDTVTVNVDGVEYSLVAYEDEGGVVIGDSSSSFDSGEGQFGWVIYIVEEVVMFYAKEVHTVSYLGTDYHHKIDPKYLPASFKPEGKSYLTFSSLSSFTLAVSNTTKNWNGTLEYFASDRTWTIWDGTAALSSVDNDGEYVLYLRGTGNSMITENSARYKWVLSGSDISCIGNIENLLDYTTVASGEHPTMADNCYASMFRGCTSLTKAPALPATTLANYCYANMFNGCTNLTQAPNLPATTLANNCYENMFRGCTSLTKAPDLPATVLADYCYYYMFYNCTSLAQAPSLPATTMAGSCYSNMFYGCTNLTTAPALPATTIANWCYSNMFQRCTSLTQAPALPATTMADYCYANMFNGCTNLTQAPNLPATTLANNCYENMFRGCTSLTKAPALPATTLANYCYNDMFRSCISLIQVPVLPAITLADHCYYYMFDGCTSLELSSVKTDEYTQEYRIPSSDTGTTANNALTSMFASTGGPFTGTPKINTTYYLSSDNIVVRKTEISTLNDYVGSMIEGLATQEYVDGKVPDGGTAGQLLTKTADGQEWKDREEDIFVVNMTTNDGSTIASSDKTFDEVQAAYNTGKTVIADLYLSQNDAHYILPSVLLKIDQGIMFAAVNGINSMVILMRPTDIVTQDIEIQDQIIATGLLKGDGSGGVSAAVAGTDYITPSDMTSAIQSAIQNTWEASY